MLGGEESYFRNSCRVLGIFVWLDWRGIGLIMEGIEYILVLRVGDYELSVKINF